MNTPAKILIVDDTLKNVKLLADLLTIKGYSVVTAESGREALAQLDAERPDLVLLDVVMPEMSGYEVCRKIRENAATTILRSEERRVGKECRCRWSAYDEEKTTMRHA